LPTCGEGFWRNAPAFAAKQANAHLFWQDDPLSGVKGGFCLLRFLCRALADTGATSWAANLFKGWLSKKYGF